MPCRPVSAYPCKSPCKLCSESISITRPSGDKSLSHVSFGRTKALPVSENTASSLFEYVSSGDINRKSLFALFNLKTSFRYSPARRILLEPIVPGTRASSENNSDGGRINGFTVSSPPTVLRLFPIASSCDGTSERISLQKPLPSKSSPKL